MVGLFIAIHRGGKVAAASAVPCMGVAWMAHWRQRDCAQGTKKSRTDWRTARKFGFWFGWFLASLLPDEEDERCDGRGDDGEADGPSALAVLMLVASVLIVDDDLGITDGVCEADG